MSDCATNRMRFETESALALEAAFDGGRLTSDGGLLWLSKMDSELGLCEALAEHVPEWRKRKGPHSLVRLIRQRVFQIACGYEDQNDSNSLREDPLLKMVCGSLPESGADLASRPSAAWRMRLTCAAATGWPRHSSNSILGSGARTALRGRSSWISIRPMIPHTEIRKALPTMATTVSICTTH
jgi:hypothetical protein